VLPVIKWSEMTRILKNKTIAQVNWGIKYVKYVGKVLFVQTTPTPIPFLRFTDDEKAEIGDMILKLANEHNIGKNNSSCE